jgi:hypothetical protein
MAGKNRNKQKDLNRFLRYTGRKMSASERNAFERELQKDPFSEEAVEGLEGIPAESVIRDLKILDNKILSGRKKRVNYLYRIAASVIVLLSISTLLLVFRHNKQESFISKNETGAKIEINKIPPLSEPKKNPGELIIKDEEIKAAAPKNNIEKVEQSDKQEFKTRSKTNISDTIRKVPEAVSINVTENARPIEVRPEAARLITRSELKKPEIGEQITLKGKIISSEDNQPVPGAAVIIKGTNKGTVTDTGGNFMLSFPDSTMHPLVASFIGMDSKEFRAKTDSTVIVSLNPSRIALNEVVVVGYGAQKKSNNDITGAANTIFNENTTGRKNYTPPQPARGKENFDKYIEKNISRPSGTKPGREVVVLTFTVKSSGALENLRVIRSPGKEFSTEALRLINNGPAWLPAEEDNLKIDDEVRIRIVFR